MGFIDLNTDENASFLIFNKRYLVRMRAIDNLSPEIVETFGTYTSLDPDTDRESLYSYNDCYQTISQIAVNHQEGKALRIVSLQDIEEIYKIIYRHLQDFDYYLSSSPNINKVPMDDLVTLSELAKSLIPYIDPAVLKSLDIAQIEDYSQSGYLFDPDKAFKDPEPEPSTSSEAPHEYLVKSLEEKMIHRGFRWK